MIKQFFKRLDLRIATKTAIAAGCSYAIANAYSAYFSRPDILTSGLWCVVASIVVMQANIGSTYKAGGMRFIGSIIGSIIGATATFYLEATPVTLGLTVAITIVVCAILQLQEAYRIAALSGAVVMLSWAVHPELVTPWEIGFFRSLDASVGIIIAIIVSHIILPEQTWLNIQNKFIQTVQITKTYFHQAVEIPKSPTISTETVTSERKQNKELENLLDLLTQLRAEVDEAKVDIFSFNFNNNGNDWLLIIRDLDILVETIAIVEEIPKENLNNILDESLKWHVEKFIDECQKTFDDLQSICLKTNLGETSDKIPENEHLLVVELERFRKTHVTRDFSLADVENLYSYFFHLRYIAKLLRKVRQQLMQSKPD
ncbi:MAG: FUSC family protein [Parachlamydiaceae bacterium]|nr:FUSC family protein [Parachlamydiaceae bacterium]